MSKKDQGRTWERWEKEVEKFKHVKEHHRLPEITMRTWRRSMLFMFMQDLMKNVLNENESVEKIMERVIEAIQIGCGFKRIRIYLANEKNNKNFYLWKTSEGHGLKKGELKIRIDKEKDDAVETFSSGEPLAVDDVNKLEHLKYKIKLDITGPYVAIPLIIENEPFGLICADTASDTEPSETIEYKEHFKTFARTIMAAIENRKIFDQRNQQIEQLKLIDKFSAIIQGEKKKEKLFESLLELSVKLVKGNSGHFKLYNSKTQMLERVADCGEDVAPPEIKHKPISIGFSNWVFRNKKSLIIGNVPEHLLMIKHQDHWKKQKQDGYLKTLGNRKSAIVVPLKTHIGDVIGVLDIHGKTLNQFTEQDEKNLGALVNSVIYAVEKTQQLEQKDELLAMRNRLLTMLQDAVEKAHNLNSVLEIIRDSCSLLVRVENIKIVCLLIKDPHSNELKTPTTQCVRTDKNCNTCLRNNPIINQALNKKIMQQVKNTSAFPILLKEEVIAVLYLEGEGKIVLDDNEIEILKVIMGTAAILIETARNYEIKIKQGATLYEAIQYTAQSHDFREWFYPVMEQMMEIIGRKNRTFHLVLCEKTDNETKIFVRATSDLFTEGEKISMNEILLDKELSMEKSLSGFVVKNGESVVINNVENNTEFPYHEYDKRIKSEVVIPMKIKKGIKGEEMIGALVIDSIIPNDFKDFDLKFHETIANSLAVAIHNQKIHAEHARYQEERFSLDRSLALQAFMISFFHDITAPVQEIQSRINILGMQRESKWKDNLALLEELSEKLLFSYNEFVKDFTRPFSEPVRTSIREIIENSLENVERTKGLGINKIEGNFENSEINIECYMVFVEMAFRSIINNAVKYSRKVEPEDRYLKIDVNINNRDNLVIVSFESSSEEEIPQGKLNQVFKPFVRFSKIEQGQGLGLSLAAECINFHNGEIYAKNVKGKSAVRFIISLPQTLRIKKEY